jgi:ferritin
MLSADLEAALNEQLNKEYYSSYLYLGMSAHFEDANLPGMAAWMRVQAEEENQHAMKFFDHILARGGRVHLTSIAEPPTGFGSPLEVFEGALEHERFVTSSIDALFKHCGPSDGSTVVLLQWFSAEQVEEEQTVGLIAEQLRMAGGDGAATLMLDRELGARAGGGTTLTPTT